MSTKFVHIRYPDTVKHGFHAGETIEGTIAPRGGITIAIDDKGDHWLAAQAMCHPRDNYVKKLGRVKAEGRLKSRDGATMFQKDGVGHDLKEAVGAIAGFYKDMAEFGHHAWMPVD